MQNESWQDALVESRAWTREEAVRALTTCDASGMEMSAFARKHGTTGGRLRYWRKRLEGQSRVAGGARLLPVQVVGPGEARFIGREPGRVVLVDGGIRLELEGMTAEWVATLIRLVRAREG